MYHWLRSPVIIKLQTRIWTIKILTIYYCLINQHLIKSSRISICLSVCELCIDGFPFILSFLQDQGRFITNSERALLPTPYKEECPLEKIPRPKKLYVLFSKLK